jgi:iron complex outermembrane receptor protein
MARHLSRLLVSAAVVASFSSHALAQEAPPEAKTDAESSSGVAQQGDEALPNTEGAQEPAGGLQEIVVTAQRREENLQDVPVAVTALDAAALAKNDIRDLSRVEVLTPGFSFGKSGSDARPAIRGVRTENVAASGDPTIGFFVDNVYRSRASQANEPFVDVARVEVQRGPQGTLYGRNTFGGNVTVLSVQPKNRFDSGGSLTLGSFVRGRGEGFINVPLGDTVAFRVAGLREKMEGYVKGPLDNDIMSRDTTYLRASALFQPTENINAVLRYSYWTEAGTGGAAFGYRVGGIFVNPATGTFDIVNGQPFQLLYDIPRTGQPLVTGTPIDQRKLFYPGDTRLEQELRQHSLSANVSFDLGPAVLRSITGYTDFEAFRNADNDFSLRPGNVDAQEDHLKTFSQEVQLASGRDSGPFEWIVGGFYYNDNITKSVFSSCPTAERNRPGCAFAAGVPRTRSHAAFGQASYWLLPDTLRLTAGIRHTRDNKRIRRLTATTDADQRLDTVTPTGQQFNLKFKKTTYRIGAEYHVTDRNMIYASYSTGFRSGGFNAGFFTNPLLQAGFGPEDVRAYEIGTKNRFLDNRLQLNLSAYRNNFKDLQVQNQFLVPSPGGGTTTTSIILNAAKAHSQGIEAEVQAVPIENLNVAISGTLMKAEYDDYRNVPAPANYSGFLDLTGNDIPYAPSWKMTGVVSYDFNMGAWGTVTPQATLLWSDGYYNTDLNTVLDRQDRFSKLDLRLGWTDAAERFSVEGFVNNVTNEITLNRATFGSRGLNQSYDAPRMYGLRVGAKLR